MMNFYKLVLTLISVFVFMILNFAHATIPLEITKGEKFDVYYIQDERVPKFYVSIYFADGVLAEVKNKAGATEAMFQLLTNGTKLLTQENIASDMDQLGMSLGGTALYESSTFEFSGLMQIRKDITNYACNLLKNSTFPQNELQKYQTQTITEIKNLISSHSQLVERVSRQLFYAGTPLEASPDGSIETIKKLVPADLIKQRDYLLRKVKKRVFIQGPKKVLDIVGILNSDCGFASNPTEMRSEISKNFNFDKIIPQLYFIPIKNANQAQIRMTKVLTREQFLNSFEQNQLTSSLLGGSFSSMLMQEVRVKKGLTYSISASAPTQANYGRSYISTFSRNEGVVETVNTVQQVLKDLCEGKVSDDAIENAKRFLKGSQLLSFDDTKSFLSTVSNYYHKGRTVEDMEKFPKNIESVTKNQLMETCGKLYVKESMSIAILGDESLKQMLINSFGKDKVKIINYENFL